MCFCSCQNGSAPSNEIVFADVIGNYSGECASFEDNTSVLSNRESASLNIFAASLNDAGVKVTCDRFEEYSLSVTNANAARIDFAKTISNTENISMSYFAAEDSIVLTRVRSADGENDVIFAGVRD